MTESNSERVEARKEDRSKIRFLRNFVLLPVVMFMASFYLMFFFDHRVGPTSIWALAWATWVLVIPLRKTYYCIIFGMLGVVFMLGFLIMLGFDISIP